MKKFLAIFLLASMTLFSPLINSCINAGGCSKSDLKARKFYTTDMYGKTIDRTAKSQELNDTSVVRYSNLRINIRFSGRSYSENFKNLSLISSAYACSPAEPYSEERIADIIITANQDFDASHPMGSNLADVFYVNRGANNSSFTVEEYIKTKPRIEDLDFFLVSAPRIQKKFQFTITYYYDGRLVKVLKYDTPSFNLTSY